MLGDREERPVADHPERDWRDDLAAAARKAGIPASVDEPDAILMAETRNLLKPGGTLDQIAENLAADLEAHATEPITRAMCAVMLRAASNAQGLTLLGYTSREILTVVGVAASKLEMRAKP